MAVEDEAPRSRFHDLLHGMRASTWLDGLARVGLVGRGVFYLLLAALAIGLVLPGHAKRQANANGALTEIAGNAAGEALLIAAGSGFLAFGLLRLVGAALDRRPGRLRRLSTAGQGVVHLGLAAVVTEFLLGRHGVGSEGEQQQTASTVLRLPGGRLLLGGLGVVVLATCLWQLVVCVSGGFADTLHLGQTERSVRKLTLLTARIGIPARALAVAPLGAFLLGAAVEDRPAEAKGLDGFLTELTASSWGTVVVVLVALGFAVFAVYSMLEARFRHVSAGS